MKNKNRTLDFLAYNVKELAEYQKFIQGALDDEDLRGFYEEMMQTSVSTEFLQEHLIEIKDRMRELEISA